MYIHISPTCMGIHSRVFPVVAAIREKGHQDLKKQNMGEP